MQPVRPPTAARWIVAASDGRAAAPIARRYGARRVGSAGAHVVPRRNARAFAAALRRRGLLAFAEPNLLHRPRQTGTDPFTSGTRWRPIVVEDGLVPPSVTSNSPKLALDRLEARHQPPGVRGRPDHVGRRATGRRTSMEPPRRRVAAAPTNGRGIEGVWPGMIATNFATDLSCGDIVSKIEAVVRGGYDVLNMSYGAAQECFAESAELQRATGAGVLLVAAAGNEFAEGNPLEYPASLPHVVTVAAVDLEGRTSYFSNANAAVDLAAPGESVGDSRPDRSRSRRRRQRLRAARRHELRGADRGRRRRVGGREAPEPDRRPAGAGGQAVGARPRPGRLGPEHGLRPRSGRERRCAGTAPRSDPLEPNEDIFWVNGRIFRDADPIVYDGKPRRTALPRSRRPVRGSGGRVPGPLPGPVAHSDQRASRATATPTSRSTGAARTTRRRRRWGSRSARAPCATRS